MTGWGLMTAQQAAAARQVLDAEGARREHVVVYLSGAHAYGFPSPDSDLDLKAIHVVPTEDLLGFNPPAPVADRQDVVDGVEIDYTSNEIGRALEGMLAGNGNFIERVMGTATLVDSALLEEARPLVRASLSRRSFRHYDGFARGQLRELERSPTAKRLLYVLRTALTGTHLLRTGELITDLAMLAHVYGHREVPGLIERKCAGERTLLAAAELEQARGWAGRALDELKAAASSSPLPELPPNREDLEAFLRRLRRNRLA
ncbi:MAG: nucleotidyltransferase domain-containing protein [Thermoanaerobaculaceae bacterium]|nr:nucleotidyltransferase domain-containing protein [Thermoanaerobaculaceae bacterium]